MDKKSRNRAGRNECEKKMRNGWSIKEKSLVRHIQRKPARAWGREGDLGPREKGRRRKCGAEGDEKRAQRREGDGSPHFSLHNSPCSPRGLLSTHCGPL